MPPRTPPTMLAGTTLVRAQINGTGARVTLDVAQEIRDEVSVVAISKSGAYIASASTGA